MELTIREKCFCCGSCLSVCPHNAIYTELEDGFIYPVIDKNKCVDCGLCKRACPAEYKEQITRVPKLFSFKHSDECVVNSSSSGGAFTALSDWVLSHGGVVIGASLDEDNVVRHHIAYDATGRDAMRGAKYVQSDMSVVFKEVSIKLKNNHKPILFSGTPCQTKAFQSHCQALGIDLSNVYLCSLVCHGASSSLIWKEYIEEFLKNHPGENVEIRFRDKENGWRKSIMTATIDGHPYKMTAYSSLFFSSLCNPRVCFSCPFAKSTRDCDITMGDFWSIQRFDWGYDEENGVSKLLAHTEKGEWLINQCSKDGDLRQLSFNPCSDTLQPALTQPYRKPVEYEQFWKDYQRMSYAALEKKYTGTNYLDRIRRVIRKTMLKIIKNTQVH